jgi:hypothetical protein
MTEDGVVRRVYVDEPERLTHFVTWQECEPIIERNKQLQNEKQTGEGLRHVGTIPYVFVFQWLNEEWSRGNLKAKMTDREFVALMFRKLQDPDYKWLRTV